MSCKRNGRVGLAANKSSNEIIIFGLCIVMTLQNIFYTDLLQDVVLRMPHAAEIQPLAEPLR